MPDHLYRFRSTGMLLGKRELQLQKIYFCPPDQLNDPIEGFKDIFWIGDDIVWRSLLKNYVMTLVQVGIVWFTGAPGGPDFVRNAVKLTPEDIADADIRAMCESAMVTFLKEPAVTTFIEEMAQREIPIRRFELLNFLRLLHPFAAGAAAAELLNRRILPSAAFIDVLNLPKLREKAVDFIKSASVLRASPDDAKAKDVLFSASESAAMQIELIGEFMARERGVPQNVIYFLRYFTADYVSALDGLVHPDWFVACFSANPTNASMWGTYGHGHRGICLKFRTTPDGAGKPSLPLQRAVGMTGDDIIYDFQPLEFRKVEYEAKFPPIDFFRTLGGLRIVQLNHFWYRGEDGKVSVCRRAHDSDEQAWRNRYWDNFAANSGVKTNDWQHEQEYRLVLHSYFFNLSETSMRLLDYRFEDLTGIVFGARTALKDKLEIMRIIEEKCHAVGRTDFEFSEVRYAPETGTFNTHTLSLLKIANHSSDS